jgi:hypothetical protein
LAGSGWESWSADGHRLSFENFVFVWDHPGCWLEEDSPMRSNLYPGTSPISNEKP